MGSSVSGSEKLQSTVKERKEKKKQDKIADVSYHAETRPEAVKMKKEKRNREKEDEEPPSGDKKKKKRKKEKTSVVVSDPASTILTVDIPLEVAGISEAAGVPTVTFEVKEKKKRKNKSLTRTSDHSTSSAVDPTPSAGATDKSEKPRKRKYPKDDTANTNGEAESKSKPKKRAKREVVQGEDHYHTASAPEDPSHKRKKPKKSTHPDPSDDPDLTEQSRKALTYIHSQSTSPETWKFNKARQNWIVRNVWTSKVPEKYVSMVVDYLSKVQGLVRETLIESCNKVISGSNVDSPASRAGVNEEGSPESTNPPPPDTIGSEKTQRAHALLLVLTENRRRQSPTPFHNR